MRKGTMKTFLRMASIFLLVGTAAHAASGYHVLKTIKISDPGNSWDYAGADNANRHIFISHGPQLEVIDADSDQVIGKIVAPGVDFSKPESLDGMNVRGATAAADLGRGFMPSAKDNSISIFDLKTLKVLTVVKVGQNPDGYAYDPATHRGFTFSNREPKGATAVDIAEGKVAGTVSLSGKPEAAAADGQGHMFVNIEDKDLVTKFNSRTLQVEANWPTAPCQEPASMAIDAKNHRLFVGCRGKAPVMLVMNTDSGNVITSLPIGDGTDAAVFDPQTRMIFSSNGGAGTLTVIQQESADKYKVADTVKTEPGARTMALDLKTHKIYLINADRKPAAPAAAGERPARPEVLADTFRVLVVGR